MKDALLNALSDETIVHANSLATVTRNCVLVRDGVRGSQAVIGIERITEMRKVVTTKPGLLIISCGVSTIAAASYASDQGLSVVVPIAFAAALFVMGYVGTRRGAVLFTLGAESIESVHGSLREATSVIRAVNRVRRPQFEEEPVLARD